MAGAYPRPFKHVKDGHFPIVVVNFHRAANRSSQKPPRKSPRLAGEEAAVLMYDVEPDYWCLRCPYYESNTDRRCTKPDWIFSSQKENHMTWRLAHFDMPASFETKEKAEEYALTFKVIVETLQDGLDTLDAWSIAKPLDALTKTPRNERKRSRESLQDSGIFLFYVLNFNLRNFTIKRY